MSRAAELWALWLLSSRSDSTSRGRCLLNAWHPPLSQWASLQKDGTETSFELPRASFYYDENCPPLKLSRLGAPHTLQGGSPLAVKDATLLAPVKVASNNQPGCWSSKTGWWLSESPINNGGNLNLAGTSVHHTKQHFGVAQGCQELTFRGVPLSRWPLILVRRPRQHEGCRRTMTSSCSSETKSLLGPL